MTSTDVLRGVPLFEGMTERSVETIADLARPAQYATGAALTTEGEPGETFIVLRSGTADVEVGGTRVSGLGAGDYLGEISLIDHGPRMATVRADTALHTLTMAPFTFRPILQSHPDVSYAVLVEMCNRVRMAGAVEC